MTDSFESIVKSENSLPDSPENHSWGFPWCNNPCHGKKGTDRQARRNKCNPTNQRQAECHGGKSAFAINDKKSVRKETFGS